MQKLGAQRVWARVAPWGSLFVSACATDDVVGARTESVTTESATTESVTTESATTESVTTESATTESDAGSKFTDLTPPEPSPNSEFTCERGVVPAELDRGCETPNDCALVLFPGVCGCTWWVLAYNVQDREQLLAHLDSCPNPLDCDCPPRLPETDDGELVNSIDEAIVECVSGSCQSRRDPAL